MAETLSDFANQWLEFVDYDKDSGLTIKDDAPPALRATLGENDLTSDARLCLFVESLRVIRDQSLTYDQIDADPRAYLGDVDGEIFDTWYELTMEHRPEIIEAFALPGMDEKAKVRRAFELVRESVLTLTARALHEQLEQTQEVPRDS